MFYPPPIDARHYFAHTHTRHTHTHDTYARTHDTYASGVSCDATAKPPPQEIINYLQQATSDVRDRDKVRPVYEVVRQHSTHTTRDAHNTRRTRAELTLGGRVRVRVRSPQLLDRVADRVHEHNAPFLFEYLGIKREAHPTDGGYIDEDHHYPPHDEDHHRRQQQREEHEPEAEIGDAREEARGGEAAAEEREAAEAQDATTSAVEEETKPPPEGQAQEEKVVEEGEQESGHHRGEMDVETAAALDDTVA